MKVLGGSPFQMDLAGRAIINSKPDLSVRSSNIKSFIYTDCITKRVTYTYVYIYIYICSYIPSPPRWCFHLIVVRGFEYARYPESYTSGSVATGRTSLAGQVKG
jgi:hypothetical protein